MKSYLVVCLFFLSSGAFAQSDYHTLNERFSSEYGELSYDNLDHRINFLDSISNIDLSSGKEKFLMDLGTAYGWKQVSTMSDSDQKKSLEAFNQCWEEFGNQDALFQVMSIYLFIDCSKSLHYCELLEAIITRGELKKEGKRQSYEEQIATIREFCSM